MTGAEAIFPSQVRRGASSSSAARRTRRRRPCGSRGVPTHVESRNHADNDLAEGRPDFPAPLVRAAGQSSCPGHNGEGPGPPRCRGDGARGAARAAKKIRLSILIPAGVRRSHSMAADASRIITALPALSAYRIGRGHGRSDSSAAAQAFAQFCHGGPIGKAANLRQQVVRKGHNRPWPLAPFSVRCKLSGTFRS
jgi:hypothetical protein